jgi:AcrR family transcriptional regulator
MSTQPKRRLSAEERRTGILDAALAVFSQRGYHDASIDDIASEAGVSKALIYEHFASKQELYADLIARNARELTQRVAGALSGVEIESTVERLATGLEA